MNKTVILVCMTVFSAIGSYVPVLLGDKSGILGGWSILAGLIGGIIGIWVGAIVSKRWG